MGIPSYFKHIILNYRQIIAENKKSSLINNLYLDSNSIIYDAIHLIENKDNVEKQIFHLVYKKILFYVNEIKPTNTLFIAFDGVAPAAKLHQQRTRRYKAAMENNIFGMEEEKIFNTVEITPGTKFMENLDKFINLKFKNAKKLNLKKIIVSGPSEPGEGEHKIFELIRNQSSHNNEKTVIYGLDADLIMLSLNHLQYAKEIYLYRETPHFIKNLDDSLVPNKSYLLNIPLMKDKLLLELELNKINGNNEIDLIKDYIFIFFFLGNDFLPHFPALSIRTSGIEIVLDSYRDTLSKKGHLTNSNKIIWKNLKYFIELLGKQEHKNILDQYKIREKQSRKVKNLKEEREIYLNLPLLDKNKEIYINPQEMGWEHRYYDILLGMERSEHNLKKIVKNYLEGLEWNLAYYNTGCKDWRWSYKYNYPPLLRDIYPLVPYFDIEMIEGKMPEYIDQQVQLAFVLPRSNFNLLSKKNAIILGDLMNYKYNIEYSYCRYIWEGHIEIDNSLNVEQIEEILNI